MHTQFIILLLFGPSPINWQLLEKSAVGSRRHSVMYTFCMPFSIGALAPQVVRRKWMDTPCITHRAPNDVQHHILHECMRHDTECEVDWQRRAINELHAYRYQMIYTVDSMALICITCISIEFFRASIVSHTCAMWMRRKWRSPSKKIVTRTSTVGTRVPRVPRVNRAHKIESSAQAQQADADLFGSLAALVKSKSSHIGHVSVSNAKIVMEIGR